MSEDWPGDPDVDLAMDLDSQLDLDAKNAPIDWPAIEAALDEEEM